LMSANPRTQSGAIPGLLRKLLALLDVARDLERKLGLGKAITDTVVGGGTQGGDRGTPI